MLFGGESIDTKSKNADQINPDKWVDAPFEGWVEGLPKIQAPEGFDWQQFKGIQINVISENTPPSSAIAANIDKFEKVTGIKVNIEQSDLGTVVEKVSLDFNAKSSKYHVIYADPYQILAKYSQHFVDLNLFNNEPTMPHIPGGVEDFIPVQLEALGHMGNKEKLLALPYDNPTMVLAYRKDVFEKYKDLFMKEKGYDWTPRPGMTWDQYYEIAKWINQKVKEGVITEVKYGTGHQAKQYDSLMCDFSNILAANGGDYFEKKDVGTIGTSNPGKSAMTSKEALESAEFYNKLLKEAAPGSTSWDWNGLAEAFAAGEIAMAPEWHEFSAMFESGEKSKVAGKVGWTILPKGKVRSANIFGGTGIGINKYASDEEKKAAWLFLVWATSPQNPVHDFEIRAGRFDADPFLRICASRREKGDGGRDERSRGNAEPAFDESGAGSVETGKHLYASENSPVAADRHLHFYRTVQDDRGQTKSGTSGESDRGEIG